MSLGDLAGAGMDRWMAGIAAFRIAAYVLWCPQIALNGCLAPAPSHTLRATATSRRNRARNSGAPRLERRLNSLPERQNHQPH